MTRDDAATAGPRGLGASTRFWLGTVACLAVALSSPAVVQGDEVESPKWEQVFDRKGIVIHRQSNPDGQLPRMRATASIDASVLEILAVLQDSPRRIEWMARCVESVEIQRIDLFNGVYYSRMAAWPFDDRDVVVAIETSVGNDASSATVRMVSVESELMGPVEGVVRMPAFAGHYRLTQLDTAGSPSTLVEYELAIEFGGGLSGRIAQLAREDIPFETLLNLRTHVPDTRDEYAKLVARWRKDLPSLLAKSAAARQTDAPVESADPTVGAGAPRETPAE